MQDRNNILTDSRVLWSEEWIRNAKPHHDIIARFLQGKLSGSILDIGDQNPLTERPEKENRVEISNTSGDLDSCEWDEEDKFDVIICSHVIEHLMNPLWLLWEVQKAMKDDCKLYLIAPVKPYWITPAHCHFHEMDFQRMKQLIDKSGLKINGWTTYSVPISFRFSLRNWLRRLFKEYSIITLVK